MTGLADQATLAADATFIARVEQAILTRIRQLIVGTPDSGQRALYYAVLDNPTPYAQRIAKAIAPDTALAARAPTQATATDAEISAAVTVALPFFVR